MGDVFAPFTTPHPIFGKVWLMHQFGPLPEGEGEGRALFARDSDPPDGNSHSRATPFKLVRMLPPGEGGGRARFPEKSANVAPEPVGLTPWTLVSGELY